LRYATKKYWDLRDQHKMNSDEAAAKCWETYPNIHLVPYKKWTSTKGNPTDRRGPVPPPHKMTKKTGPKPKMNKNMTATAKQMLLRHPKASNSSIAQNLPK